ncbi:rCG33994 [Rattus norvegicus]|uniref:RCG33994 n=1 Tax=Rattus norvegicus TaxID=10116 RepID=A6HKD8_RAT|nr:rCG33994 [Rattus norvegicus]
MICSTLGPKAFLPGRPDYPVVYFFSGGLTRCSLPSVNTEGHQRRENLSNTAMSEA